MKNVVPTSVQLDHTVPHQVQLKFQSLGAGFFPQYFAFFVRLPPNGGVILSAQPEVWDNSVIVQLEVTQKNLDGYDAGLDETSVQTFTLPAVDQVQKENLAPTNHDIVTIALNKLSLSSAKQDEPTKLVKKQTKPAKDKRRSYSESNCDDFVHHRHASAKPVSKDIDVPRTPIKQRTYSECSSSVDDQHGPQKHLKGILKRRGSSVWSISESSLDEHLGHSRSVEFGDSGSIAEVDEHMSEHAKKSVRFDNNIRKFCFR